MKVHPLSQQLKISTDRLALKTKTIQVCQQPKVIRIQEHVENRNSNPRGSRILQNRPTIVEEEEKDQN